MTQKDALEQALTDLGGRAHLKDIYPVAIKYITHKEGSKIYDSLRGCIHDKRRFRPSPGFPAGWYELLSYQEDIAVRDKEIAELKAEVERLKKVPTEDDFVKRLIKATKNQFRFKRNQADAVRQVMDKLGRSDADADLTAWMERRESKPAVSIGKLEFHQGGTNIDTNYGPNIEHNGGMLALPKVTE
ncbi:MAG: hypothetical protein IJ700_02940 [Bacteroidaceae bacterium]|nr:hypothetical protein [Bacteroidaceae bacterium]